MKFLPLIFRYRVVPYFFIALLLGSLISGLFYTQATMPNFTETLKGHYERYMERKKAVQKRIGDLKGSLAGATSESAAGADSAGPAIGGQGAPGEIAPEADETPHGTLKIGFTPGQGAVASIETVTGQTREFLEIGNDGIGSLSYRSGSAAGDSGQPLMGQRRNPASPLLYLLAIAVLWFYNRPIARALRRGIETLQPAEAQTAKTRILNITRFAVVEVICLALVMAAMDFWRLYNGPVPVSVAEGTARLAKWLCFCAITSSVVLMWFDHHLLRFIPKVFARSELYALKRNAKSISIGTKVFMLTVSTSIIPLFLVSYINLASNPFTQTLLSMAASEDFDLIPESLDLVYPAVSMLFSAVISAFSIVAAVIMGRSLRRSLSNPLNQLITRMEEVKSGRYDNLSTVYTNDEIGQLKGNFNEMVVGLKEREFIKDTFGRFMSVEISRKILGEGGIALGGEEVEATVLFSDIRDFTAMSEKMGPSEVVAFLNEFFSFLVGPILENRGVINKYIGDCVMALFGVPDKTENHAEMAVRAALGMRRALEEFNALRSSRGEPPVRIGIGIHTGKLVSGNIGARERMEYTVIGDTVNVASRIESQTKLLGACILVSREVLDRIPPSLAGELPFEKCPAISVKGKTEPLELYRLFPA